MVTNKFNDRFHFSIWLAKMDDNFAHRWGGLVKNIADMASDGEEYIAQDPSFQQLKSLEEAKTPAQVFSILDDTSASERNRINSPLLDLVEVAYLEDKLKKRRDDVKHATLDQVLFMLDRGLFDLSDIFLTMCRVGNKEIVGALLDRGVDIHTRHEEALFNAAYDGHKDVVELLLDRGADIHANDDAAFCFAAKQGHKTVVEFMLDRGADIHAGNDYALRHAASYGHLEVAELLLDRGADVHSSQDLALVDASKHGHKAVVELLLDRGARFPSEYADEDHLFD